MCSSAVRLVREIGLWSEERRRKRPKPLQGHSVKGIYLDWRVLKHVFEIKNVRWIRNAIKNTGIGRTRQIHHESSSCTLHCTTDKRKLVYSLSVENLDTLRKPYIALGRGNCGIVTRHVDRIAYRFLRWYSISKPLPALRNRFKAEAHKQTYMIIHISKYIAYQDAELEYRCIGIRYW